MCTVTFLPISNSEFILTSNRDEQVTRETVYPLPYSIHDTLAVFPLDQRGNGTWFATTSNRFTLCLLNGAFEKHISKPPYKQSRGLMLLDFFEYNDVNKFVEQYDFNDIEPFTLLILDSEKKISLTEIRWDGNAIYKVEKDPKQPYIWSSATLYSKQTIKERENWFKDFLKRNPDYNENKILEFHHFGGKGDHQNDLVMNRNNTLKTVSITSVSKRNDYSYITYEDTLRSKKYERRVA